MPKVKRDPHDWPTLNQWLYTIGITDNQIRKHFLYSALVDYFPGSKNGAHLIPAKYEIDEEKNRLHKTVRNFNPEIVVPIGRLSIAYCLDQKVEPLVNNIGKIYHADPYLALNKKLPIIPLPHPSGASTWRHNKRNRILLKKRFLASEG